MTEAHIQTNHEIESKSAKTTRTKTRDFSLKQVLPRFNFRALPLSRPCREQLAKTYEGVLQGGQAAWERANFRNLILNNCYDPIRGIYIPTGPIVKVHGKWPIFSEWISQQDRLPITIDLFGVLFFTNAMVIPKAWGTSDFNLAGC